MKLKRMLATALRWVRPSPGKDHWISRVERGNEEDHHVAPSPRACRLSLEVIPSCQGCSAAWRMGLASPSTLASTLPFSPMFLPPSLQVSAGGGPAIGSFF